MFYERPGKKGVEEAKQNLQKAIEAKKFNRASIKIQCLFRSFLSSQQVSEKIQTSVRSKLQDIKKLKQSIGDRLKFLPLPTIISLIRSCKLSKSPQLVAEMKDWILLSLDHTDPRQNLLSSSDNWSLFTFIASSYSQIFKKDKEIIKYLLNLFSNKGSVGKFYIFLLFMQLTSENLLLRSVQRHLEREILLNPSNQMTEIIKSLIDFIVLSHELYYSIDCNDLNSLDKRMVYEGFVEIQNFIVQEILSIPRIAKFILKHPGFTSIKWKEMIQSYYYGNLANQPYSTEYNEKEIFLFGNIWEIFQSKLLQSLNSSDLAHFLSTCSRLVRNLTPSVLESSSNASITESENLKNLRKQISLFTSDLNIRNLLVKVFGNGAELDQDLNEVAALALCEIYIIFLDKCAHSKDAQIVVAGILGAVAFSKFALNKLWKFLTTYCGLYLFLDFKYLGDRSSKVFSYSNVLSLFASSFKYFLFISNDDDFPFMFSENEIKDIVHFCIRFNNLLVTQGRQEGTIEILYKSITSLLTILHDFNVNIGFIREAEFLLNDSVVDVIVNSPEFLTRVLDHFPFCIPFDSRVNVLFMRINELKGFNYLHPSARIVVRRNHLIEDSVAQLINVPDLRGRLEVQFINSAGTVEDGFDAGGLFKEFWTSLSQEVFRPEYGLFSVTSDQSMYPNPNSCLFFGSTHLTMFYLVGRIIGKAIFERITIEPKFAEFFLQKMTGKQNFVNDIRSLDLEMYNNLMFLKNYKGNAEDLSLTFTVSNLDSTQTDLVARGSEIPVTNANKLEYIYKLAHHKLNEQIKDQCSAFFRGFNELVPVPWLKSFTSNEMQKLISGVSEEIDLSDLMANTKYVDCSPYDSNMKNFWRVMESFSHEEKKMLLKFVTSCHRSPLLGFKNLHPPFTLSKQSIDRDDEKLPSSQTCMNILRVPTYSSWKVMREKLLIAINSGAGFEFR